MSAQKLGKAVRSAGRSRGLSQKGERHARGVGQFPSNVRTFLKGVSYPATKDDLLKAAKNGAPREIVDILNGLSAEEFGGPQEVMKGYGEERQNSDSK